jgi:hypothetical protein
MLVEPQSRSGRFGEKEVLILLGFEIQTVQPVTYLKAETESFSLKI